MVGMDVRAGDQELVDDGLMPSGPSSAAKPRSMTDTAALMVTNPNTRRASSSRTSSSSSRRFVHAARCAQLYMDGANMNALMGARPNPGDMGVDVMQFNLHKTFSTPHGGGGPGSGPVAVRNILAPYLPVPVIRQEGAGYRLDDEFPHSIGRVHGFLGNAGIWIRAFAYIRTLGAKGLMDVTDKAVLNANYLLSRLREVYAPAHDSAVMHECVLTDRLQQAYGVTTSDIAKRLMDYGFHPPTIYFPLVVSGALMIEPTETEPLDALDRFADALLSIAEEAENHPELVTEAPVRPKVGRLDEVRAARKPRLRWTADG